MMFKYDVKCSEVENFVHFVNESLNVYDVDEPEVNVEIEPGITGTFDGVKYSDFTITLNGQTITPAGCWRSIAYYCTSRPCVYIYRTEFDPYAKEPRMMYIRIYEGVNS